MGKAPSFQFYPGDWTRDLDDQDLEVEGAWIRIVCRLWWSETPGQATKTIREWSRILRKSEKKTIKFFQILLTKNICSGELLLNQKSNQKATIICRRMVKDYKISELRRSVGSLGGNPTLIKKEKILDNQSSNQTPNQNPTPSFSYSSINITPLPPFKGSVNQKPDKPAPKKQPKSLSLLPEDFQITDEMRSWFKSQNFKFEIDTETEQWKDYCRSKGKMMKDWTATWRNGMRLRHEWNQKNQSQDSKPQKQPACIGSEADIERIFANE